MIDVESTALSFFKQLLNEYPSESPSCVSEEEFKNILAILNRAVEIAESVDISFAGVNKDIEVPIAVNIESQRTRQ